MMKDIMALAALLGCAGAAGLGCGDLNTPIYITASAPLLVNEKMVDENDPKNCKPTMTPDVPTGPLVLRFRQPSQMEQDKLNADSDRLGFDVPWLKRDRIHIELLYTVKNVEPASCGKPGTFTIGVDGANEYTKYDEAVVAAAFVAANEKPVSAPLIQPTPVTLAPGEVYQGTIREDDFVEGSLDLDAMGRWMAPFAAVLINRSDVNPIGLEMVPPNVVVPAMQEIDLTLGSPTGTSMTCEFMARVRTDDDQLWHESSDQVFVPTPTVYVPMIMAQR